MILYRGNSRIETVREIEGNKGYAVGFEALIDYLKTLLPSNEEIGKAFRKEVPMYPELAIRELVANAIIHQDFSSTGTGPMIEIFDARMEITNPWYSHGGDGSVFLIRHRKAGMKRLPHLCVA